MQGPIEIPAFGDDLRGSREHGRVSVMAASMHDAIIGACIFRSSFLTDRQGIDIGANAERAGTVAIAERGDDTGSGKSARYFVTHFPPAARQ